MARWAATAMLAGAALGLAGCGTMVNLTNDHKVYGGTCFDAGFGVGCMINGGSRVISRKPDKFPPEQTMLLGVCAFLDLPVSAVADTVTLPVTIPWTVKAVRERGVSAIWYWEDRADD